MIEILGRTINLRLIQPHDAEFVYELRTNPNYNKYLSQTKGSVEDQKKWIIDYKERECNNEEYYFIITRKDTEIPTGTIRIYDFTYTKNSFCWGSWILDNNKTRYAAIESAMLIYNFGFESLKFQSSHFDVRKSNTKVISFHTKMGAKIISEDKNNIYFKFSKHNFESFLFNNLAIING